MLHYLIILYYFYDILQLSLMNFHNAKVKLFERITVTQHWE